MYQSRPVSSARRALQSILLWVSLAAVIIVLLTCVYVAHAFKGQGYENCRANGSSAAWCIETSDWQTLKAVFQRGLPRMFH